MSKRQHIIAVARQIVAASGFRQAQVAAIATAAGVSTGTVYRHFPSKADLLVAVYRHVAQREVEVAAGIALSGGSARVRLGAAIRAFAQRAIRGRRTAFAMLVEPVDPEVLAERSRYHLHFARVFESILVDGMRAGEFPEQDLQTAAACIVGALSYSLAMPLSEEALSGERATQTIEAVADFCLNALSRARIEPRDAARDATAAAQ
jgi:AcrR family transcriptional regulator